MPRETYSFAERLLHRLALGSPLIASALHDMELSQHGRHLPDVSHDEHVFVCGLARAGTTILLRQLHATGAYVSLTYRDMPFVLAPNFWRKLNAGPQRHMTPEERAHGDGIAVDYDSPEAFDEVFWRVFSGKKYLLKDRLIPMEADDEQIERYRRYVALVLRDFPGRRYLCKNNNNLLRLPTLAKAFPRAHILVPIRHPRAHAESLLRQHLLFQEKQQNDPFLRRYMTWLGHHEFGAAHRPFVFDGQLPGGDPQTLDYWIERWIDAHRHLLATRPPNARFLSYETLCNDGGRTWNALLSSLGHTQNLPPNAWKPLRSPSPPASEEAESLHQQLLGEI